MTPFDRDMVCVLCGAGEPVLARREQALAGFEAEFSKCLNPFRKQLLCSEIKRQRRELTALRNQRDIRAASRPPNVHNRMIEIHVQKR